MVAPCAFPSARGSQVLIRELAQALADRGHEVHVVTYPSGEHLAPLRGMFVHRARVPALVDTPALPYVLRKLLFDICLAVTLYRVIQASQIHVIHAHNYEGPLVAYVVRWLTGVPVVYHSHNALSDELAWYVRRRWLRRCLRVIGELLDRQVPRRADFTIALTPQLDGFLRSHGVAADRIATIPPGCTPPSGDEGGISHISFFTGRFVVLYAGNLDPYQDLSVLFRGYSRFRQHAPHALLVVVTHDAQWIDRAGGELVELVRAGHAEVVVAPTFHAVRRYMAQADVLVCPRSSWSGFPIKLLNYCAAGRPIVVAQGAARSAMIEDTAVVVGNGDAEGLAAALSRLCDDADLRRALSERARVAAAGLWTWRQVAHEVEAVYAATCKTGSNGETHSGASQIDLQGLIALSRDRISAAYGDRVG